MPRFVLRDFSLHRLLFVAAISAGLAACSSVTAPETDLAAARQRWAEHGPTSYTYTLARDCFCLPQMMGPVVISVEEGAVVSRTYVNSGAPVAAPYESLFPTMAGVFDIIDEAIRQGAEQLEADYHATLGYPVTIGINMHQRAVDGGLEVTVSAFKGM